MTIRNPRASGWPRDGHLNTLTHTSVGLLPTQSQSIMFQDLLKRGQYVTHVPLCIAGYSRKIKPPDSYLLWLEPKPLGLVDP